MLPYWNDQTTPEDDADNCWKFKQVRKQSIVTKLFSLSLVFVMFLLAIQRQRSLSSALFLEENSNPSSGQVEGIINISSSSSSQNQHTSHDTNHKTGVVSAMHQNESSSKNKSATNIKNSDTGIINETSSYLSTFHNKGVAFDETNITADEYEVNLSNNTIDTFMSEGIDSKRSRSEDQGSTQENKKGGEVHLNNYTLNKTEDWTINQYQGETLSNPFDSKTMDTEINKDTTTALELVNVSDDKNDDVTNQQKSGKINSSDDSVLSITTYNTTNDTQEDSNSGMNNTMSANNIRNKTATNDEVITFETGNRQEKKPSNSLSEQAKKVVSFPLNDVDNSNYKDGPMEEDIEHMITEGSSSSLTASSEVLETGGGLSQSDGERDSDDEQNINNNVLDLNTQSNSNWPPNSFTAQAKGGTTQVIADNAINNKILDGSANKEDDEEASDDSNHMKEDDFDIALPTTTSENPLFEEPFQVYDSSVYRRICAPVGESSIVCMTIKYPWEVEFQDPRFSYPRPVNENFFEFKDKHKNTITFVDGDILEGCKNESAELDIEMQTKYCLDKTAENSADPVVVVVFTRQRSDGTTTLFGTGTGSHLENMLTFFDGQVVQVFGDSTGPGVTNCMQKAFGDCVPSRVERKSASFYCGGLREESDATNDGFRELAWEDMDESYNIFLGMDDYYCPFVRYDSSHQLPSMNLYEWMDSRGMVRNPGWTELRGLTLVISYAFAHMQTEDMILNRWNFTADMQYQFPELIMAVQTDAGKLALAEMGYDLKHVIVFDGLPQYFPTSTSAYFGSIGINNETEFVLSGGYPAKGNIPAWKPEYGHTCRGPVPTTSEMTKLHRISRQSFETLGLDMRFYIRNWEFSNQFWWLTSGWYGKNGQLDCTHGRSEYYCAHKYLLQATIDDYFDNLHHEESLSIVEGSSQSEGERDSDDEQNINNNVLDLNTQSNSNWPPNSFTAQAKGGTTQVIADNAINNKILDGSANKEDDEEASDDSNHMKEDDFDIALPTTTSENPLFEEPFQVYDSSVYRRICAPVGESSIVCMTIKYPWEVEFQDPRFSYPRPVNENFFEFKDKHKNTITFVDGDILEGCKNESAELDIEMQTKYCLDKTAENSVDPVVVVVFTRQRSDGTTTLFGTGTGSHLENMLTFFDGQVVQVFGDSTGPGVTNCMQKAFGDCVPSRVERKSASFYCGGLREESNAANDGFRELAWEDMDESYNIFLGMDDYYCPFVRYDSSHQLPSMNLYEWMDSRGMVRNPGWTELRGLTLVISYAFAHMQTEDMILNRWNFTADMQYQFPELIMAVQTDAGKLALAEMGYDLKHVIVFDGLPQYFPTSTSAYFGSIGINNETEFVLSGGYPAKGNIPAWKPEYGHTCRGPVPTTSEMTKLHRISRQSFETLGLDMRFYIRNWEFSNQFWWLTSGWYGKNGQLDCTHGRSEYYCAHKYLLQATIDDYFDNLSNEE